MVDDDRAAGPQGIAEQFIEHGAMRVGNLGNGLLLPQRARRGLAARLRSAWEAGSNAALIRRFVQLPRRLDGVFCLFQAGSYRIQIARHERRVDVGEKSRQLVQSESPRYAEIALPD